MKTRLFVALALVIVALSIIPASATFAAGAQPQGRPNSGPALDRPEVVFVGQIQSLPKTPGWIGTWKVSGKTVRVSNATLLDQTDFRVRKGARVRVEGFKQADGSYSATSIDILS